METVIIVLGVILFLQSLLSLGAAVRFARYALRHNHPRSNRYQPKAVLIVPCKGLEHDFEDNMRALFAQEYRDYEIIFVTETENDPAYGVLSRLIKTYSRRPAWLVVGFDRADLPLSGGLLVPNPDLVLLIPQAMAYAVVAGLPPQVGLYASVLPSVAYALLGTSPYVGLGPAAVIALMVSSALAAAGQGDPGLLIANAQALSAVSALSLLALWVLRAGAFMAFLSRPVLDGFTSGAALLIVLTQLPTLLGIQTHGGHLLHEVLRGVWQAIAGVHPATLGLGLASIALLVLGNRPLKALLARLPLSALQATLLGRLTPLVVLALATLAVSIAGLDARGVATVGAIPAGLPPPSIAFMFSFARISFTSPASSAAGQALSWPSASLARWMRPSRT